MSTDSPVPTQDEARIIEGNERRSKTPFSPVASPPRSKRISLSFWRPSAAARVAPIQPATAVSATPPIGHQARVLFAILSGQPPPKRTGLLHGGPTSAIANRLKPTMLSSPSLSEAAITCEGPNDDRALSHRASRKAVKHQEKAMKQLKRQLMKPDKARKIMSGLKRMQEPTSAGEESSAMASSSSHPSPSRAFALQPLSESVDDNATPSQDPVDGPSNSKKVQPFIVLPGTIPALPPTTAGGLGALAGAKSGALELLADASGALARKSGSRSTFVAPFDTIGVFIYWWGFELSLPPPTLLQLAKLDSIQSTLFPILQAIVTSGGAPELAPIIRYIASYVQMELGAIKSQDRGFGVVVAATWLLPVALVPRPWDFPLPLSADSDSKA